MKTHNMRPINFIEFKETKQSKDKEFSKILMILPLLILLVIILYDYKTLNQTYLLNQNSNNLYSEEEILNIKEEIELLKTEKDELSKTLSVLNSLDKRSNQDLFNDLISMSINKDTDQDFLVELSYFNDEFYYKGNSIDTSIPENKVVYFNDNNERNLFIDNLDYSNGYYTYILKIEDKNGNIK